MKNAFIFLCVIASTAMAKPAPKVLALVKVKFVTPGKPGQLVKVYENGVVENYECPITEIPCHVIANSQLNDLELQLLTVTSQQTLEMPEQAPPKDDRPHCMAMPNEYREFYLIDGNAKEVQVAEEATPCGRPKYKNPPANSLAKALDKLVKEDEE